MIDHTYLETFARILRTRSEVDRLDAGLTDSEVDAVQRKFAFTFPPDLRTVLQFALPIGKGFPNWRDDTESHLRSWLDGPVGGIWFDVEWNGFWRDEWGPKPAKEQGRSHIVRSIIDAAPRLIPIFVHRYTPAEPNDNGNPVFSVHQTDVIYYGNDLADYFHREFGGPLPEWAARTPRPIRFWDDALRWRDAYTDDSERPSFRALFLRPWKPLTRQGATFFEKELKRELATHHILYGRHCTAIAITGESDDVLVLLDDVTFAQVHLTYTRNPPERPGWPKYRVFDTLADWMIEVMIEDHVEHFGLW